MGGDNHAAYYGVIVHAIAPYFEERLIPLDKLTTMDIQNFYSTLKQKGDSGNTILHYHANIRKSLADAVKKYKLIPYNPAADATRPKIDNFVSNYYDAQQLAILLDAFIGFMILGIAVQVCFWPMASASGKSNSGWDIVILQLQPTSTLI